MGALDFLVSEDFFTGDELEDALMVIADDLDVTSERVRRMIRGVMEFTAAGD